MIQGKFQKLMIFAFFAVSFCVLPTVTVSETNARYLQSSFVNYHAQRNQSISHARKNVCKPAVLRVNPARRSLKNSKTKLFNSAALVNKIFVHHFAKFQIIKATRRSNQPHSIDCPRLSVGRAPPLSQV